MKKAAATTRANGVLITNAIKADTPNPIKELSYNEDLFRFEWETAEDFEETDKIKISYNFVESKANPEEETSKLITYIYVSGIENYFDEANNTYLIV